MEKTCRKPQGHRTHAYRKPGPEAYREPVNLCTDRTESHSQRHLWTGFANLKLVLVSCLPHLNRDVTICLTTKPPRAVDSPGISFSAGLAGAAGRGGRLG